MGMVASGEKAPDRIDQQSAAFQRDAVKVFKARPSASIICIVALLLYGLPLTIASR